MLSEEPAQSVSSVYLIPRKSEKFPPHNPLVQPKHGQRQDSYTPFDINSTFVNLIHDTVSICVTSTKVTSHIESMSNGSLESLSNRSGFLLESSLQMFSFKILVALIKIYFEILGKVAGFNPRANRGEGAALWRSQVHKTSACRIQDGFLLI